MRGARDVVIYCFNVLITYYLKFFWDLGICTVTINIRTSLHPSIAFSLPDLSFLSRERGLLHSFFLWPLSPFQIVIAFITHCCQQHCDESTHVCKSRLILFKETQRALKKSWQVGRSVACYHRKQVSFFSNPSSTNPPPPPKILGPYAAAMAATFKASDVQKECVNI